MPPGEGCLPPCGRGKVRLREQLLRPARVRGDELGDAGPLKEPSKQLSMLQLLQQQTIKRFKMLKRSPNLSNKLLKRQILKATM